MVTMEEIIKKIAKESDKTESEIKELVKKKKEELPRVSDQGIASLIARELNVRPSEPQSKTVNIKDIVPGMGNIGFVGKVIEKGPIRKFSTDKGQGRVQNITLADKTGKVRMSLWNKEIDKSDVKENDVVKLECVRTKKDNLGNPDVRLGYNGMLKKIDKDIEVIPEKTDLKEVNIGDDVNVDITLLDIYPRLLVYYFCPKCRSKTTNDMCPKHDLVDPDKTLIVSGLIDDGNRSMDAVFFGEQAEKIIDMKTDEVEQELMEKEPAEVIASLGLPKKFKVKGQITKNKLTEDMEIRAKTVNIDG